MYVCMHVCTYACMACTWCTSFGPRLFYRVAKQDVLVGLIKYSNYSTVVIK